MFPDTLFEDTEVPDHAADPPAPDGVSKPEPPIVGVPAPAPVFVAAPLCYYKSSLHSRQTSVMFSVT